MLDRLKGSSTSAHPPPLIPSMSFGIQFYSTQKSTKVQESSKHNMHLQHSTWLPKNVNIRQSVSYKKEQEFLYNNTASQWHTKDKDSAYDNLYCIKNEIWRSLHCFQYNAMYQTAKGYGVYRLLQANKLHIDSENGSIAICNFWIWMQIWNVLNLITARKLPQLLPSGVSLTSSCCQLLLPATFVLYLKHGIVWYACYLSWRVHAFLDLLALHLLP